MDSMLLWRIKLIFWSIWYIIAEINLSLEFDNYPLKELREGASVFSGFAFKSSDFVTGGIPVIKIKNIQNQHVSLLEGNEYFLFRKWTISMTNLFLKTMMY